MIKKSERTIDVYERAGGLLRLLKAVGTEAVLEASKVLHSTDTDRLLKALELIDRICVIAEENMFNDHPELSRDYLDVFYGTFTDEVRNETDLRVRENARRSADELFTGKSN